MSIAQGNAAHVSAVKPKSLYSGRMTKQVGAKIVEQLKNAGRTASLDKTRMLPSTLVELSDGKLQILANTFVSVTTPTYPARSELVSSVVTVKYVPGKGYVLETVKVPALEPTQAKISA